MEIINLDRILPGTLKSTIEEVVKEFTKGDEYEIFLGQIRIGVPASTEDEIISSIIVAVCKYFAVPRSIVMSETRKMPYMLYRQMVHYLVYKYTGLSTPEVAQKMKMANHTSILHSIKTVKNRIDTDIEFMDKLEKINEILTFKYGCVMNKGR